MPPGPAAAPSPADDLLKKAGLYVKKLQTAFESKTVDDYWKCGNAACSLLDYFRLIGTKPDPDFISAKHKWFEDQKRMENLWFDDYLWWAIAALKGGSMNNNPRLDPPWDQIFNKCWNHAQPSRTVWQEASKKYPQYQPRFDNGVWNANWGPEGPWVDDRWNVGAPNVLWGIQNAVVNLLYLNVAARTAYFDPSYATAAQNQWKFLTDWFDPQLACESLLYEFAGPAHEECVLVRERVSTFHDYEHYRDYHYTPFFYWTGDQGLLLGAMIHLMYMPGSPQPTKDRCLKLAVAVINGVRNKLVEKDKVLPWKWGPLPQDDEADYISGSGVFLRYLLQAWADPVLKAQLKKTGFDSLVTKMASAIPDPPSAKPTNKDLNPWTNQLATLLAAAAIQKSPA